MSRRATRAQLYGALAALIAWLLVVAVIQMWSHGWRP